MKPKSLKEMLLAGNVVQVVEQDEEFCDRVETVRESR